MGQKMKMSRQQLRIDGHVVHALGDVSLFRKPKVGLLCSQQCAGDIILQVYDFARLVQGSERAIVSGFHSPIENDCLPILLRGAAPIIIIQGHRLSTSRLLRGWQKAIDAGRLLLLSPFTEKDKRVTADLATKRNRFVATISDEVLIPYAAPGSKTETLALELLSSGKRVFTFNNRSGPLLESGAQLVEPGFFATATNVQAAAGA